MSLLWTSRKHRWYHRTVAENLFYDEPDQTLLCPYPQWHMWRGVTGLVYARRLNSTPPIVFRASGPAGQDKVLDEIAEWVEAHPGWDYSYPVPPWESSVRSEGYYE